MFEGCTKELEFAKASVYIPSLFLEGKDMFLTKKKRIFAIKLQRPPLWTLTLYSTILLFLRKKLTSFYHKTNYLYPKNSYLFKQKNISFRHKKSRNISPSLLIFKINPLHLNIQKEQYSKKNI